MEQERQARETEEKERSERMKKIKDQFADPNSQWEKDKTDIQNEAMAEKAKEMKQQAVGSEKLAAAGAAAADSAQSKPKDGTEVSYCDSLRVATLLIIHRHLMSLEDRYSNTLEF